MTTPDPGGPGHGGRGAASTVSQWLARSGWSRTLPVRLLRAGLLGGVVLPLLRTRLRVESLGEVPSEGPTLLVANHASHLDALVVLAGLPAEVRERCAIAAAPHPFFHVTRRALPAALLLGAVPYRREAVTRLLRDGGTVLVFTQPSRTADGTAPEASDEIVELARTVATAGTAVVPVGVRGTFATLPRGQARLRRGRARVSARFGRPLRVEDCTRQGLTDAVRALVAEDADTWWQVLRGTVPLQPSPGPAAARWRRIWAQTDRADKGTRAARRRIWR